MISIGQLSALDGMSTKASIGVLSRLSLSISSGPLNPAAEGNEPNEHALQTVITRQIAGLLKRRNGPDYHVGSEEILDEIDEMIEDAFDESLTNFDRTRRSINTDGLKLEDIYRDTIREVLYGDRLVRDALSFIRSGYFADNADMVNFALEALNADIHSLISIFKLSDFALIPKKEEAIIGIVDELAQGLLMRVSNTGQHLFWRDCPQSCTIDFPAMGS
ncbi:MAG: hypothetical protein IKE42_28500 [Aquamicrobium sp.]|nr:hypothetical protein [Aquamicrobium sp.]